MAEKKSKALALELIDDLLKEGGEEIQIEGEEPKNSEAEPKAAKSDAIAMDSSASDDTEALKTAISDPDQRAPGEVHTRAAGDEDHTVPIPESVDAQAPHDSGDRVRASVGRFATLRAAGAGSATEAALVQSESLRIAQGRILELEQEIERLRTQNEELGAAGETLRRRTDELLSQNQKRESDYENLEQTFEQEKAILTSSKEALQRDLEQQRRKSEELELRISTNIQKIRVRERELENRLELVKMEGAALIRSKDEMILELKRQMDQINLELNNYRSKNQELNRQTTDKQEMLRRTVKALRLALSMLEGEEETKPHAQRKAK
jgi:DNA repair exonuclease SbcCD ATPase subunit